MTAQSERPDLASSNGTGPGQATGAVLTDPSAPLVSPFAGGGLIDVFRRRYLLKLLVQKEIRARYQGSLLGLICTARVRNTPTSAGRAGWLILAAWAIGGTGIWVMHFMAMLGFGVRGEDIRYDVSLTAASALIAAANEAGGKDNVSVVLIRYTG